MTVFFGKECGCEAQVDYKRQISLIYCLCLICFFKKQRNFIVNFPLFHESDVQSLQRALNSVPHMKNKLFQKFKGKLGVIRMRAKFVQATFNLQNPFIFFIEILKGT
jgi:hypothetical protein